MDDLSFSELQDMQLSLQAKYQGKLRNESISPEASRTKLLWMVSEIGEVIDLVKKNEPSAVINDDNVRGRVLEEMSDVLMYYTDILLCFDIAPKELRAAYEKKLQRNMTRW